MLLFQLSRPELAGIAVALIVGITFHEFSHAYVADQLGDHRPRALGRVSLNPTHHIDPVGAVFFLVAGFGWGKPVPGEHRCAATGPHRDGARLGRRAARERGRGGRGGDRLPGHGHRAGSAGFTLQIVESIV